MVGIGDFSQELYRGTHVQLTGDIGSFGLYRKVPLLRGFVGLRR